ncbi:MAG TPA: alpha/beta fold hydrolase [Gammaproteobacteria bacterium]|nr:alpha/beta fold hydrolase [Gammaproteobacteria bacterium]
MDAPVSHTTKPVPLSVEAPDGYRLAGSLWRHRGPTSRPRPVVIVNAATSVRRRYYARFAAFLHGRGFDVITYDYRGIGDSRPASLRGFPGGWLEWGGLDFEAMLRHAETAFPDQPVHVVGHSVGGFLVGLAESSHRIERIFTMGAQFAHWRDYRRGRRLRMLLKWHLAMPAITAALGYFPGARLGWMEDTPRGVVHDWTRRSSRFEDFWRRGPRRLSAARRRALVERFAAVRAPILAVGVTDDPFGTEAAVRRLLAYYRGAERTHLVIPPSALGRTSVGHFAFFHERLREALWDIPLEWLAGGRLPPETPGEATTFPAEQRPPGQG